MENNHKLALYVAYYLSRFNVQGYENLGYQTMNDAHKDIGQILKMNPHTVKNMRDQFDPLHTHRVGWYQAPLSPSRINIVEALQDLTEEEIRSLVKDILDGTINKDEYEENQLLSILDTDDENSSKRKFILRGPTGRKAVDFFIKYHTDYKLPISGKLIDKRDYGQGYDFEININGSQWFVEVKGIVELSGGVLFTNKEWITAKQMQDKYILAIVYSINNNPFIKFIHHPFKVLTAKRNYSRIIQINYSVAKNQIDNLINQ